MCVREGETPRGIYERHVGALRRTLTDDGTWIPGLRREIPAAARAASCSLPPEQTAVLFDGMERPDADGAHHIELTPGARLAFAWDAPREIGGLRIVFDPDFSRESISKNYKMRVFAARCNVGLDFDGVRVAKTLVRDFAVYADGEEICRAENWHRSLFRLPIGRTVSRLEIVFSRTWGDEAVRLYSCDVY
jgi:hypothetical protein